LIGEGQKEAGRIKRMVSLPTILFDDHKPYRVGVTVEPGLGLGLGLGLALGLGLRGGVIQVRVPVSFPFSYLIVPWKSGFINSIWSKSGPKVILLVVPDGLGDGDDGGGTGSVDGGGVLGLGEGDGGLAVVVICISVMPMLSLDA
jgi:hypothetical protein